MRTRLLTLLVAVALSAILAVALASFTLASRHLAATPPDPFIGRAMPCGHVYQGDQQMIAGLRYYLCERGHPFPQLNSGGLLEAEQVTPPRPPSPARSE